MKIAPFETEHFFARYEFNTPYQLCNSDCETIAIAELLDLAGSSLEEFGRLSLGYTESAGNSELRAQIAVAHSGITPDQVLILGTPVEGIYLAARAVLDPGDEVVVLSPSYDALRNVFAHVVGEENVRKWTFVPDDGRWSLDMDELRGLLSPRTRLLVVNFPHNPTGYLPSPEKWEEIIDIVEQHELILFSDEMYSGLVHSGNQPIRSAVELTPRAVTLSGLSKTYGLPGLRSGWLIVPDETLGETIINWKFYTSICPPAPSEFLALAAWKVREELRQRSIAIIEANLDLAEGFFSRWPDLFTWRRPLAGSTALVKMDVPSVGEYAVHLAERAGVLIQPAGMLGSDDHHIRMGFGRRGFAEALERFEADIHIQLKKNRQNR